MRKAEQRGRREIPANRGKSAGALNRVAGRKLAMVAAAAIFASAGLVAADTPLYWDTNGTTAGSGAATGTWGTSMFWNTDSTGVAAPSITTTTASNSVFFSAGTSGTAGTVTINGAVLADSITFQNNVAITLSGGTSITLGGGTGPAGISVLSGDNAANTISTLVDFDPSTTAETFSNAGTATLTVGAITGLATSGTQTLTLNSTSSGGITLNGAITSGAGSTIALVINNTGTGATNLSGANTFAGGVTVQAGTAIAGVSNATTVSGAFGPSTVAVTLGNSSGSSNAAILTSGAFTVSNAINVSSGTTGTLSIGGNSANTSVFSGLITLNNNLTITQITGGTVQLTTGGIKSGLLGTQTVTFNNVGAVTDTGVVGVAGGAGNIAIIQSGAGATTLSGASLFTGGVNVNAGSLIGGVSNVGTTSGPFGPSTNIVFLGNTSGSAAAGVLTGGAFTISNPITVQAGSTGTLSIGGNAASTSTLSGAVTLDNNLTVTQITGGTLNLTTGAIASGAAGTQTLTFNSTGTGVIAAASNIGGGTGTIAVSIIGTGSVTFSGTNSYTGTTTLSGGFTQFSAAAAIPGATAGQINLTGAGGLKAAGVETTVGASLSSGYLNAASTGTIDITTATDTETLNFTNYPGIAIGTTTTTSFTGSITPGATGYHIGGGGGTLTFNPSVALSGSNGLTIGAVGQTGTVILSNGANSYTGPTVINGAMIVTVGTLANGGSNSSIGASSNLATNLILNGATFRYTGATAVSTDRLFSVGSSGATIDASVNTGSIDFTNTGAMGFNGQTGTRTLTLTNSSTTANTAVVTTATDSIIAAAIGDNGGATSLVIGPTSNTNNNVRWALTGNNSFTGGVNLNAGILSITNSNSLGTGTKTITINNGTAGNPELHLDGSAGSIVLPATFTYQTSCITPSPGATLTGGSFVNDAGNNVINGAIDLTSGGGDTWVSVNSGSLTINATVTTAATGLGTRSIHLRGTGNGALTGVISNGLSTVGLFSEGTGTWVVSGANTFTGPTTLTSGTLNYQNGTAFGTNSVITEAVGGTVQVQGNIAGGTQILTIGGLGASGATAALENVSGTNSYAGKIVLAGGATTIASDAGTLNLTSTTAVSGAFDLTLTGAGNGSISGGVATSSTNALNKSGTGTWTVAGTSTFGGNLNVSGGTLTVPAAGAITSTIASLTVAGGAQFNYLSTATQTLNVAGTLTLNPNSTLGLNFGNNIATAGSASVSGVVNFSIGGTFTSGTTYPLLTATGGGLTAGGGTYNVLNATNYTYILSTSDGFVSITPSAQTALASAFWIGGFSGAAGVWAISNSTSSNWTTNGNGTATPIVPSAATNVTFSDSNATAANQANMTLGANMAVNSLTFNSSNPATLNADGNTLTLGSTTNPGITVNGSAGAVTLNANITLGVAQTWTNNSGNTLSVGGNINSAGLLLTMAGSGNTTIGGAISGAGGVTQNSTGTLTLSGANSYAGTTTIAQGTLAATANQSLTTLTFGSATGATAVGTLDLTNANATFSGLVSAVTNTSTTNTIKIGTGHTLTLNGGLTVGYDSNSVATSTKLTVTGGGGITAGGTSFLVGAPQATANGAAGDTGTLDLSGMSGPFTATASVAFAVGGGISTTNGFAGGGNNDAGVLLLGSGTNTITTPVLAVGNSNNSNAAANGGNSTLTLGANANIIKADTINLGISKVGGILSFPSNSPNASVVITSQNGGASTINIGSVNGAGTSASFTAIMDLTGHQSTVTAGAVTLGNTTNSTSAGYANGIINFDTGTFSATSLLIGERTGGVTGANLLNAVNLGGGTFTVSGATSLAVDTGTANISGTVVTTDITSALNITGGTFTTGTLAGVNKSGLTSAENRAISNITVGGTSANPATLNVTGSSFVLATQTNTGVVQGNLTINAFGTVTTASDITSGGASGGTNTTTLTLNGGLLNMQNHNIGSAAASITNVTLQAGTLQNVLQINNGGAVSKTTTGTLTLTGTNAWTGATSVASNGGILNIQGSLPNAVSLTVNSNSTLTGSGSIGSTSVATSVLIQSGATLAPGSPTGVMAIAGPLTMTDNTSNFNVTINSTSAYSQAIVSGQANLGFTSGANPLVVVNDNAYFASGNAHVNDAFYVLEEPSINNSNPTAIQGGLSGPGGVIFGDTVTGSSDITYNIVQGAGGGGVSDPTTGSQNFIELQVTSVPLPEPTSLTLLALTSIGLLSRRRRA